MNRQQTITIIAIYLFLTALTILVTQYIQYGSLFKASDFLHHENFALIFVAFGMGMLVVAWQVNARTKKCK